MGMMERDGDTDWKYQSVRLHSIAVDIKVFLKRHALIFCEENNDLEHYTGSLLATVSHLPGAAFNL